MTLRLAPALLAALAAPAALAQPEPERLPDLAPQVFEITGTVEVALPQIERQPLTGFGPPPRTFVVPAERQSVTAPYAPSLDALPEPELAPPTAPALARVAGQQGRLEGGFGRYGARYGRGDVALPLGAGLLVADVDYDGLGSTALGEDPPDEDYVTYTQVAGRVGLRSRGRVQAGVDVGGLRSAYYLLGADVARRRRTGLDVEGRVGSDALAAPFALRARYARARFEDTGAEDATSEGRLDGDGRLAAPLGALGALQLDAAAGAGGVGRALGDDAVHYAAGGALRLGQAGGRQLTLGARVLGFETSVENGGRSSRLVAPTAGIELPFGAGGRLFARTEGRVVPRGLGEVLAENPFVSADPDLAPDVRLVDATAGLEVRRGVLGLRLAAEGAHAPTRLVYDRAPSGLFDVSYEEARTYGVGADVTAVTPGGFEASAGVGLRRGRLTETDEAIPYFAPVVGRFGVQVPVGVRGRLGLSGVYEGERPADRSGDAQLAAYGTLALDAAYTVTGGVGVTLRAERLLGDAERWESYRQAPFTVVLGARLLW